MSFLVKVSRIPEYIKSKVTDKSRQLKFQIKTAPYSILGLYNSSKIPKNYYKILDFNDLKMIKKSDTAFIFGSGASLSSITESEWQHISKNNTISFNYFIMQKFVNIDFHIVRELGGYTDANKLVFDLKIFKDFSDVINKNEFYNNTVFLLQKGWKATGSNLLFGSKTLKEGTQILRYKNTKDGSAEVISKKYDQGLSHGPGTITDCINLAYLLGFKKIVLAGIDLYDRKYFWFDENTDCYSVPGLTDNYKLDQKSDKLHRTSHNIIPFLKKWHDILLKEGVTLYTQNPKSLLNDVLPVYRIS